MIHEQKIALLTLCRVLMNVASHNEDGCRYEAIAEIERIVQDCDEDAQMPPKPVAHTIPALEPGEAVTPTERALMKAGQLIGAVRIYKQRNNCGLKKAKEEVEGQCHIERTFYKNHIEPNLPRF